MNDCVCGEVVTLGFLESDGSYTIEIGPLICWEHYSGEEVND